MRGGCLKEAACTLCLCPLPYAVAALLPSTRRCPSPPASSPPDFGVWSACSWFLRRHGDEMERLPGGAYRAHGRSDDAMNLGGIKVSSVELERACMAGVLGVAEVAAVACPTPGGGPDQLFLFVVLADPGSAALPLPELQQRCQHAISSRLNPLFRVKRVVPLAALPRNATGKVLRRTLRDELVGRQSKL